MPGRTEAERTEGRRREPALRFARLAAWGVVPLVLLLEAGGSPLSEAARGLGPHLLHFVFAFGAFVVFGVYAAVDIRRTGWPRFGWRSKHRP